MDLTDTERYATAALFALALHSTHVEMGVDKNGNSLAESDIAWGCPSEELFDEHLLTQVPLQLPSSLQEVFWGFDCMAPAGLAPRLFAWLKVPRKAWPGLLRMPDLAGNAGSPAAVEAFVALVRRYSAFLDSDLDFTTGQASRLQQHFSLPAATAAAAEAEEQQQQDLQEQEQQLTGLPAAAAADSPAAATGDAGDASAAEAAAPAPAPAVRSSSAGGSSLLQALSLGKAGCSSSDDAEGAAAACKADAALASSMPPAEAMSAAAASITAAAVAASSGGAAPDGAAAGSSGDAVTGSSSPAAAPGEAPAAAADAAPGDAAAAAAAASYEQQSGAVDQLPREAQEGTVVPAATFNPAESYSHTTSHKAVLALYEIIGGCIASNTEAVMEPLQAAAKQAEHAAAAAAAAAARRARAGEAASARPGAAWFPAGDEAEEDDQTDDSKAAGSSGSSSSKAAAAKGSKEDSASSSHQQQQQGLAAVQWYDSRARVAVKRVAHWLRVPWGQVRAFEQMWAMQALSLDPAAQPKYSSSSRAAAYLKVGAAAVGGGALLAVTGGLAAPAIAAGLGAAVSLAHGGAAAAAAVAGFAGSTAGTAAMTGLFGAWGASVGGGSAGQLYGEVKEFGFWDVSQSIYTDGKGPPKPAPAAPGEPAAGAAAAAGQEKQAPQSSPAAAKDAAAAVPAAGGPGGAGSSADNASEQQQQQQQQQSSLLYRLFSSKSSSKQPGDAAAAAAGGGGVAGSSPQQGSSAAGSPRSATTPTAQQQQTSPMRQQQQSPQQPLGRKSPLSLFQWGGGKAAAAAAEEDEESAEAEGPPARVRSQYIQLQQDAFNTDSDEDDEQFQAHYLTQQTTPRSAAAAAAAAAGSGPAGQQQQQQQLDEPQLQPVRVTDDPLSRGQDSSSSGDQSDAESPPPQQQKQPAHDSSSAASRQELPAAASPVAAAAAGSPSAAAAAAASQQQQASPGMLGGLFGRKAAVIPVYVPLLPTPVNPKHQSETRIALTIAVNGCISCMEDYVDPWSSLPSRDCDRFALVWESVCLKELGTAVGSFIAQQALTQVTQRTIQAFLYTGLVGALALPMTLSTAIKVAFGSKWLVALRRAQAAGKMLAMLLVQGCHGGRPVTLVGCSMGARLVFHCLLELARLGARGCVENVILLGAPLSCRPDRWCVARSVVAGRLINGFSVNDWTLGLLYRVHSSSSIWLQAAGIWKVEVPGVENVNLSRLIAGHTDYLTAMPEILEVINLQDN